MRLGDGRMGRGDVRPQEKHISGAPPSENRAISSYYKGLHGRPSLVIRVSTVTLVP